LLIYKFESFELFRTMVENINRQVASMLIKGHIHSADPNSVQKAQAPKKTDLSRFAMNKSEAPSSISSGGGNDTREPQKTQPIRIEKKVGRNDLCPCGSGKKYKSCHGAGTSV